MKSPMNKKSPLAKVLIVAGALAAGAGLAQAQNTYNVPLQAGEVSTMTQGQPNLLTSNTPRYGQGISYPATVAISSSPVTQSWYYADGSAAHVTTQTHVLGAGPAVVATHPHHHPSHAYVAPAETSNTPLHAGEASTMTGGAPNMLTQNPRVVHAHPAVVYHYE